MAPLPLFKLGALLVRTLSKPLAKRIKLQAANHPSISKWTIALGQFTYNLTARLNVLASGYKLVGIKPLEDAEALNRGAEIIGETTIFTVAVLVMGLEYSRQKSSEARREALAQEIHDREQQEIQDKIDMLIHRIDDLEEHLSAKSRWWGLYPVTPPPRPKHVAHSPNNKVVTQASIPEGGKQPSAVAPPAPQLAVAVLAPPAPPSGQSDPQKDTSIAHATPVVESAVALDGASSETESENSDSMSPQRSRSSRWSWLWPWSS